MVGASSPAPRRARAAGEAGLVRWPDPASLLIRCWHLLSQVARLPALRPKFSCSCLEDVEPRWTGGRAPLSTPGVGPSPAARRKEQAGPAQPGERPRPWLGDCPPPAWPLPCSTAQIKGGIVAAPGLVVLLYPPTGQLEKMTLRRQLEALSVFQWVLTFLFFGRSGWGEPVGTGYLPSFLLGGEGGPPEQRGLGSHASQGPAQGLSERRGPLLLAQSCL